MANGKPGRPSKFNAATGDQIVQRLVEGTPVTVAAQACGVPIATFIGWVDAGKKDNAPEDLAAFSEAVTRARSEFEANANRAITTAAADDWRAAAWQLERQFETRYAARVKIVREEEAKAIFEVAARVLSPENFERLVEAVSAAGGASDPGPDEGGEALTVH